MKFTWRTYRAAIKRAERLEYEAFRRLYSASGHHVSWYAARRNTWLLKQRRKRERS